MRCQKFSHMRCIITYWYRWEHYPMVRFLLCHTGIQQMLYLHETLAVGDMQGCFEKLKSSFSTVDSYETHFSRTEQKVTETLSDHGSHCVRGLSRISTCHSAKISQRFCSSLKPLYLVKCLVVPDIKGLFKKLRRSSS